ncbi:MAG: ABC transporter permease [bacterium]
MRRNPERGGGVLGRWAVRYASVFVMLAVWEISVRGGWVNEFLLPSVSSILIRSVEEVGSGSLLRHTGLTVYRALLSFLIASVLGVLLGTLMSRSRGVRWFLDPIVSVGFPTPKISFMPIFILWFGLYDVSKVIMTVFACIFPIISATYLGTSKVDRYLLWSAQDMGTSERRLLWQVVIPAALPQILSGLQIAFPVALIVSIVTEMLTSGGGLGGYMILAARFAESERVFLGIVTIAVLGSFLMAAFAALRRRLLRWHTETSGAL